MLSRPTEQSDAERAVNAFKHDLMIRVMRAIVLLGLKQHYIFPGDIPEDIVGAEHRQGVVSNAWGSLRSLEIIEAISPRIFDDARGIVAGKKANPSPSAKGRMVMVYQLCSRERAVTWLERNGGFTQTESAKPEKWEPQDLIAA